MQQLSKHRAGFEALVEMLDVDTNIRIVDSHRIETVQGEREALSASPKYLDANRWRLYRERFSELGVTGGATRSQQGPCEYYFDTHSSGLAIAGITKGYAYCKSSPSVVVDALDRGGINQKEWTYRHVADRWYLFEYFN